jgi:hypothetical protein
MQKHIYVSAIVGGNVSVCPHDDKVKYSPEGQAYKFVPAIWDRQIGLSQTNEAGPTRTHDSVLY